MTENEAREYASLKGWKWVAQRGLPLGGYWKDKEGNAFYLREQVQEKLPLKRGEKK